MNESGPILLISSYLPRLCGLATFCEEAREFIQKQNPEIEVLVISHTDGRGEGVFPIIGMSQRDWWKPVVEFETLSRTGGLLGHCRTSI